MKCWICGKDADSKEHLIKASDLRNSFRRVSQRSPIYLHSSIRRNEPVGSVKSNRLKYKSAICSHCNNERTQPHDRSWECLSKYLQTRQPPIRSGTLVRLEKVFPGSVKRSMLDVHLYFVKQFGCLIAEHGVQLSISEFSQAILQSTPHPKLHLGFWAVKKSWTRTYVARTHIQTAALDGRIVYAGWFYILDYVAVNVIYSEPSENRHGMIDAWHPTNVGKRLRIFDWL